MVEPTQLKNMLGSKWFPLPQFGDEHILTKTNHNLASYLLILRPFHYVSFMPLQYLPRSRSKMHVDPMSLAQCIGNNVTSVLQELSPGRPETTLHKTNIFAPENRPRAPKKKTHRNQPPSLMRDLLVLGRVTCFVPENQWWRKIRFISLKGSISVYFQGWKWYFQGRLVIWIHDDGRDSRGLNGFFWLR